MSRNKTLAISFGLLTALVFLPCARGWSQRQGVTPSPVSYQHIVRHHPNLNIHVVSVDLSDPRVSVRVARGGPDPDGDGPWTTTLLPVSEIARRENFDIAINGDFFLAQGTFDVEGRKTGFVRGKFATPEGLAMTDGNLWHQAALAFPYVAITTRHTVRFGRGISTEPLDPTACQIVGGSQMIVRNGRPLEDATRFSTRRHPRTAVGADRAGTRLTLMVVDGRQPKLSVGMTLHEVSLEMIRLGCSDAINLDGGGSSTMVYRDPDTHLLEVINSPSDTKERSVADALGITVRAPLPAPE